MTSSTATPAGPIAFVLDVDPDGTRILYFDTENPGWNGQISYGSADGYVTRESFEATVRPDLDAFGREYWRTDGFASVSA